jgi:predicted RNase H-like HicB family nuclease
MNKHLKEIEIRTRYGTHTAVLEPDEKGYVVKVPGLPGVVTWGKDIDHAKKMAKDAIELCIECLAEEKLSKSSRRGSKIPTKLSV